MMMIEWSGGHTVRTTVLDLILIYLFHKPVYNSFLKSSNLLRCVSGTVFPHPLQLPRGGLFGKAYSLLGDKDCLPCDLRVTATVIK